MNRQNKKITILGAGVSSLAAAATLARAGCEVTVVEKNDHIGGRLRVFERDGFLFDMGPSWYWMPEVFSQFFEKFGRKPADFYQLVRLDPSYCVFFGGGELHDLPAGLDALTEFFEKMEPGSGPKLRRFLDDARFKYDFGMTEFVFRPGDSPLEFFDWRIARAATRLQLFSSLAGEVRRRFRDARLRQILEFPVLFLGAKPEQTPALYSLMNWADMGLGTWYPMGGMGKIAEAMAEVARAEGVKFELGAAAAQIVVKDRRATAVQTADSRLFESDFTIAGADYHHVEQELLPPEARFYSKEYWKKRTLAPSSLVFYLGVRGRVKNLQHHNLFFDRDFGRHAVEIYDRPRWPSEPLFYVCAPSVTDAAVAPEGCENLFILVPIATDLPDSEAVRDEYFEKVMSRLEKETDEPDLRSRVLFRQSFCVDDFKNDYNSLGGNAYGLANTLRQTAFLKPKMRSPRVENLFFTGQLTVPGPGLPPALISGQVAAELVLKQIRLR